MQKRIFARLSFFVLFILAMTAGCPAPAGDPGNGKSWGAPEKISSENYYYSAIAASSDGLGNTYVVSRDFAKRYIDGVGWYVNEYDEVSMGSVGSLEYARVKQNGSGNAIVTWVYPVAFPTRPLYANYYTSGGVWGDGDGDPQPIGSDHVDRDAADQSKDLDLHDSGEAVAVWIGCAGTGSDYVKAFFLQNGSGAWTGGIIPGSSGPVRCVKTAFLSATEVMTAWFTSSASPAFMSSLHSGGVWGAVTTEMLTASIMANCGVFFQTDKDGNCVVVFVDSTGAIQSTQFQKTSGVWTPIHAIAAPPAGSLYRIEFAMNKNGKGMLCWLQKKNQTVDPDDVHVKRFDMATGWGAEETVDDTVFPCDNVVVALDSLGNAMAMWLRKGSTNSQYYAAYCEAGADWKPPVMISDHVEMAAGNACRLTADAKNRFTAVWVRADIQSSSDGELWACQFK
jgi:hypothetical protein